MRRHLVAGIDPGQVHKAAKASRGDADSFEAVAREWISKYAPNWVESHTSKVLRRLERDVFPWIGTRPASKITPPELLTIIRRIEGRGALETAHRHCATVGRYSATPLLQGGQSVIRPLTCAGRFRQ